MPQPVNCTDTKCNALLRLLQAGVNDSCMNCKIPHPLTVGKISTDCQHKKFSSTDGEFFWTGNLGIKMCQY